MGLWNRLTNRVKTWFSSPSRPAPPPPEPDHGVPYHPWGEPFGAAFAADTQSNAGADFSWYVAAYTPRGGKRENLEADPDRALTDRELRNADTLVIFFSGSIGYITMGGPWDDWDELWSDMASRYDEGDS